MVVVVGNDAALGIDKRYQQAQYDRLIGTDLRSIRPVRKHLGGSTPIIGS